MSCSKKYDLVFITHIPSFYKVNLYNEIVKNRKILVIFLARKSIHRTVDFYDFNMNFDHFYAYEGNYEARISILTSIKIALILTKISYRKIILCSWDVLETSLLICLHRRRNLFLTLESTIFESINKGLKGFLKKIFVQRVSLVFASGLPHRRLLDSLGFNGKIIITGGVGLPRRNKFISKPEKKVFAKKFLYVGRLSKEKNILFLLNAFSNPVLSSLKLTIVGSGPLKSDLIAAAPSNVHFVDYVNNLDLFKIYNRHDVFILPSISETWGLVVEEALSAGLPILCSENVGCSEDIVLNMNSGRVFDPQDQESLVRSILSVCKNYSHFRNSALRINFLVRDRLQINAYVNCL
jgi:glycosyltransferase involved in cell wall biosynthesis